MNTYVQLTGRRIVDHSNHCVVASNEVYLMAQHVSLAYECNDGAVTTLVFEYKWEEI